MEVMNNDDFFMLV